MHLTNEKDKLSAEIVIAQMALVKMLLRVNKKTCHLSAIRHTAEP